MGMRENLAEIQAAKDTFGGKMAAKYMFKEVTFLDGTTYDIATKMYTNVIVRFSRGE